jgi:hypothetical protein
MMQKLAWNAKKTRCGIVESSSRGAKSIPCRNAWSKPPTIEPVPSKAIE